MRLEAQIAARLLHDNVVRIYDFGQAEGTWYLVMEQVDGTSYVKRWRVLTLADRLRILGQVAEALDYAHHQGVIHRDIKPGNVLLTATDVPKLSDFGLSLLAEQADEAGTIRGTPHYMSPEQIKGKRLDFRTDLYSLGVMLYESATGAVPFTGNAMSVMAMHAGTLPERPRSRNPGLSEPLEDLILALLAKKPEARPASGAAVAQVLREEVERISVQEPAEAQDAAEARAQAEAVPAAPDLAALARLEQEDSHGGAAAAELMGKTAPARDRTRPSSPPAPAPPPVNATDLVTSPLVRKMLRTVLAEPVILSADERYLMGHYLAYLLIGSRRRGLLLRRPLDRRNADRAAVPAGDDLRLGRGTDRGGRARGGQLARPADRGPPGALSSGSGQVSELAQHTATAPALPPDTQGSPRGQQARPKAHDRRQGSAQPRAGAPDARRPA